MDYSTLQPWQEINENGVIYDVSSLFAFLEKIRDPRKARGKRYHLTTLLVIIFLAKQCGQDTPVEIADWAKNHAEVLVQLLNLKRSSMPHHNTIRRVFQNILDEAEFNRLMQAYILIQASLVFLHHPQIIAASFHNLSRKRSLGMHCIASDDFSGDHHLLQGSWGSDDLILLAAYGYLRQHPLVLNIVNVQQMIGRFSIGDAGAAQGLPIYRQLLTLLGLLLIAQLFAADKPRPGHGKISTDVQQAEMINKGHGRLEKRRIQTSAMLNDYLDWPGLGQVYRLERRFSWIRQGKVIKTSHEVEYGITSLT